NDPSDTGENARYERYTRGLFQDVFGMLHDGKDLFVLHRRNLTQILDRDGDGKGDYFGNVARISQAIGNKYDWAYGLVRDKQERFLFTLAPHANQEQAGAGSLVRITDKGQEEIAFGFRNPLGWCNGPNQDIFFTDNQGEWVATNKLCHVEEGKFYGYPNPA